jgi:Domain of unknown function (DUF4160)
MVTIYRAFGLRVVIFVDDHEPAHVHVFGDGEAKINLMGPGDEPDLVWAIGMKRNEVRRAMLVVKEQREDFIAKWRKIHG